MGVTYDYIPGFVGEFFCKAPVFFVGTAPNSAAEHINVSPKGYDTFRFIDKHSVAYLDFSGSGAEGIGHMKQNGRVCIMANSFEEKPMIMRLYGYAHILERENPNFEKAFNELYPKGKDLAANAYRAIIYVHVHRAATSCGFAVPLMEFKGERPKYRDYSEENMPTYDKLVTKYGERNAHTLDGIPSREFFKNYDKEEVCEDGTSVNTLMLSRAETLAERTREKAKGGFLSFGCPFPHTLRDMVFLGVGAAITAMVMSGAKMTGVVTM
eukprot:GFYU01012232.1.p1 GENE.GFYU01012232.1~~GFYU01012232.1.p1  ORF type:complete len:268 (-),score=65.28 GFYU01012232.1:219-1022(-)